MSIDGPVHSWSTSQLVEFLAVLSEQPNEASAQRAAVERVLESFDAEVGVLFGAATEPVVVGLRQDDDGLAALIAAVCDGADSVHLAGLGQCRTAVVALDVGDDAMHLLVARAGSEGFLPDEMLLLRGMAWVLDLALRPLRAVLVLNERQRVLEHIARVQRAIANRVPLPELFGKVTESALSLFGSELAILHLVDRDELSIVSVSAISEDHRPSQGLLRVSAGVAQEVCRRGDLVRTHDHLNTPSACPELVALGAGAAMGAPVRENGTVAGSLVVFSFQGGHVFVEAQEQALLTFADQVSVALSDAKTFATAQHAVRDPVTGLPNRILFLDRLERALADGNRAHVLFLDLDRFKLVNDTLGHAAGDDLLREVGRRLRECLGSDDCLARYGGDEYAVLMENASEAAVKRSGERMLAVVQEPYLIGSEAVIVGGSIGVASGEGSTTAGEILRNADIAMYRAKHAGGGLIVAFEQLRHPVGVQRRGAEADLRRAVRSAAPPLVLQPQAGFNPLAEQTELIVPLGWRALSAACAHAVGWPPAPSGGAPHVSVSITAHQLLDPLFMARLGHILAERNLDPTRLGPLEYRQTGRLVSIRLWTSARADLSQ